MLQPTEISVDILLRVPNIWGFTVFGREPLTNPSWGGKDVATTNSDILAEQSRTS